MISWPWWFSGVDTAQTEVVAAVAGCAVAISATLATGPNHFILAVCFLVFVWLKVRWFV